ncbi:Palmitoyltransferase AKR1 [Portunus trituberculatus]|uniref:Palmitoyltransferase AKR1 n=1 Tax=Portunus trituberculatus TaxID=210409 RepID=A0A5B7FHE4_PORTR|nr:Palmitoyltransferase AKR1 [Portunus trituberculatus]
MDQNTPSSPGKTALHDAASFGREDIVTLLLEYDADVAAVDAAGKVALHEAAWLGRKGVVEALLAHNASVFATDNNASHKLFALMKLTRKSLPLPTRKSDFLCLSHS